MTMIARSGERMAFTPSATVLSASMSRPESVSSSTASFGSSTAIWNISLRFFSPPENPSFTGRFNSAGIEVQDLRLLLDERHELHGIELREAAMLALRVDGRLQEVGVVDAGNFDRILKRHEDAFAGAVFRRQLEEVLAVVGHRAAGHFDFGVAGEHARERALARAVRAHDGVDLALVHLQIDAAEDVLVPPRTCRFLISSMVIRPTLPG